MTTLTRLLFSALCKAVNAVGTSLPAPTASVRTRGLEPGPMAPITVESVSATSADVRWQAPAERGSAIEQYM